MKRTGNQYSISVVIPVCNETRNISRLLPILSQLKNDHSVEIIISASDEASNYKECCSTAKTVILQSDQKGRAPQMNYGAAHAKGDILVFLHADVTPPKEFYSNITTTIASGYKAGLFSYKFDKRKFLFKINEYFTSKDSMFTGGGDQCLFIRKNVFNEIGGFDEKQILMEDFEIFNRIKKEKISYKIINNDLLVSARKYEDNSYIKINLTNLMLVFLFKLGISPNKLKAIHNALIK